MKPSELLAQHGWHLPEVPAPAGAYSPAIAYGKLIQTSGQLPMQAGKLIATGVVPDQATDSEILDLQEAARICALNAVAAGAQVAGGIDRIKRVVKVSGFVACQPAFSSQAQVLNGASNLLQAIFLTPHARSAVGVSALPLGASIEVEVLFEVA